MPQESTTILLAEDEPSVRNMVTTILKGHGYRVLEASNGQDALELAEANIQEDIDLLLTCVENIQRYSLHR